MLDQHVAIHLTMQILLLLNHPVRRLLSRSVIATRRICRTIFGGFLAAGRIGCKMAAEIRQSLASLLNSGLSPKDLTERYRGILSHIVELENGELVEGLKSFIDAGM